MNKKVKKLVEKELAKANEINPQFHSTHEAYGVITEEITELKTEIKQIKIDKKYLKRYMIANDQEKFSFVLRCAYDKAINAACEAIQVAAMARKGINFIKEEETKDLGTDWSRKIMEGE